MQQPIPSLQSPRNCRPRAKMLDSWTPLAKAALLVKASYRSGAEGHLLAFVDAREGAEHALAREDGQIRRPLRRNGHHGLQGNRDDLPAARYRLPSGPAAPLTSH